MAAIYLDHNATTPMDPAVAAAMHDCQAALRGNPASQHSAGRRARAVLEDAREAIACLLGADLAGSRSDRLVFTSGGTEANNLAVFGLAGPTAGRAVTSQIEHPSVAGPFEQLEQQGWQIDRLPTTREGLIALEGLAELLEKRPRFVSLMLGNNETGALLNVSRAARDSNVAGVPLHTDAVQVVGKLEVNFRELGVVALSFAAHKFHGPVGIGGLLVRHGTAIEPLLFGGLQQQGLRGGTEPVALAVGMQKALELWHAQRDERRRRLTELRDRFEARLLAAWPGLVVHAQSVPRLPHTSHVSFPGLDRQVLVVALDLAGVQCSTGSACASGSSEPSPTLVAMGCPEGLVGSALRFSLGAFTPEAEVDSAVDRIIKVCNGLQARIWARKIAQPPRTIESKSI